MANNSETIIKILECLWPRNKAKGLLAQTVFYDSVNSGFFGPNIKEKLIQGCWLLAPKETDFYKFRFCFFVHPNVLAFDKCKFNLKDILGENYRPFHAILEFMSNAGIGIIYAIPTTEDGTIPLAEFELRRFDIIKWKLFNFQYGCFTERDPFEFFSRWSGNKGRATSGNEWDFQVKSNMLCLEESVLRGLLLNEIFYSGFIKGILRKPLNDPYDVDSFLISLSQRYIFPMEIKEKFPSDNSEKGFFGIDAGRVMMLLRLCLPNDSNAIYLIREVDKSGNFIGWKYITLTDIIMTASWNLQAGGLGMGGQNTQTIRLHYKYFKDFTSDEISEEKLKVIGNMPKDIKNLAKAFSSELSNRFTR